MTRTTAQRLLTDDPEPVLARSPRSIRTVRLRGLGALILIALTTATEAIGGGAHVVTVGQKDRAFAVPALQIERGDIVRFTNEDGFLHQIFSHSVPFSFDSDEQKPGDVVDVPFPVAGTFQVLCGIHPKMHLEVLVR